MSKKLLKLFGLFLLMCLAYFFVNHLEKQNNVQAQCEAPQSCTWDDWYCACQRDGGSTEARVVACLKCEEGTITKFLIPYLEVSSHGMNCPTTIDTSKLDGGRVDVYCKGNSCS